MKRLDSRGIGMVLSMIVVAVCSIMALTAIVILRTLETQTVYQQGSLQAQSIAKSGVQDAMLSLSNAATANNGIYAGWTTGFTKQAFGGGYFTVTLSTTARPWITSTGYAPASLGHYGRVSSTVKVRAAVWPFLQFQYGVWPFFSVAMAGSASIDSYNSNITTAPLTFGTTGNVYFNESGYGSTTCTGPNIHINGTVYYVTGNAIPANCNALATSKHASSADPLQPWIGPGIFQYDNDDLTGITPSSAYNASNGTFTLAAAGTATFQSGVYFFDTFNNAGTITLDISTGPVVIFVGNETSIAGTVTSFGTVINPTGIPRNFFFYTWGTGNFTVNGVFYGVISAENAGGQAAGDSGITFSTTAYGAVTCNYLTLNYPFHEDVALSSPSVNMVFAYPQTAPSDEQGFTIAWSTAPTASSALTSGGWAQ